MNFIVAQLNSHLLDAKVQYAIVRMMGEYILQKGWNCLGYIM